MYTLIKLAKRDRPLQAILISGIIIQFLTAFTAQGFFHPDQHFQIIEFSSLQLHKESYALQIWEYTKQVRPSVQVYIFSGFRMLCDFFGMTDLFDQMTLLRILQSFIFWGVLNVMAIWYFYKQNIKLLYIVLALLNFSWFLPYSRTLFSSEITSSLLLFSAFFYFHRRYINKTVTVTCLLLTGFLFAFSFFLRFHIAFALIGLGCWLLMEKKFRYIIYLAAGFAAGVLMNIALDKGFYDKLVFTPYLYFKVNILEGKAASFGEAGLLYYPIALLLFLMAPPLSVILLYYYGKISLQQFRNPLVISVLFFIAGHFFIGHKEERFMFPVVNILPVIIGFGLTSIIGFYNNNRMWRRFFRPLLLFSILLNSFLLISLIFTPYSQTVNFANNLNKRFKNVQADVYCLSRTPLETESLLQLVSYYRSSSIHYIKINSDDSLRHYKHAPLWVATTYNQSKNNFKMIDSLGYKPVAYSSRLLWGINTYLNQHNVNTINDIWVLYQKKKQ